MVAFLILFICFDHHFVKIMYTSLSQVSCSNSSSVTPSSGNDSLLSPVGSISRPKSLPNSSLCSESTTSSVSTLTSNYPKAPGFEREDQVHRVLSLAWRTIQHMGNLALTLTVSLSFTLSHSYIYFSFIICHAIFISALWTCLCFYIACVLWFMCLLTWWEKTKKYQAVHTRFCLDDLKTNNFFQQFWVNVATSLISHEGCLKEFSHCMYSHEYSHTPDSKNGGMIVQNKNRTEF